MTAHRFYAAAAGLAAAGVLAAAASAQIRSDIRIVGSSTVFPFTTAAAENFGARSQFPTPVVEATGTGAGMNQFCAGVGQQHPDITGASRPMRASEYQLCQDNGVTDITEVLMGYDGIVIGNSVDMPVKEIEKYEIFLALASQTPAPVDADGALLVDADGEVVDGRSLREAEGYSCERFIDNPYRRWSDIDAALPNQRIEVFGPPPTSGTRDAFLELGMFLGARQIACLDEMHDDDLARFERIASRLREDGAWVDAGENDNAIVQTLTNTPTAFGVFGYSFLEQNGDRIQGSIVGGVEPTYDAISTGEYPISRSLFLYVKNQHVGVTPGIQAFVEELTSEDAWGPFGYLADRGLVALPETERPDAAEAARSLAPMDAPGGG